MAQATITITDNGDDQISVKIEFDPAISNTTHSVAHSTALRFFEILRAQEEVKP